MPADNDTGRLRWHYRAAEVWETGAKEVGRAFDVLARCRLTAIDDTRNEVATEPDPRLELSA